MIPTRRFALVMAATAPVWLFSASPVGLAVAATVSGLALLAGIADALAIPSIKHLRVKRSLPPSIGLGDAAEGQYDLNSIWPLSLRLELYDMMPAGLERTQPPTNPHAPSRVSTLTLPA